MRFPSNDEQIEQYIEDLDSIHSEITASELETFAGSIDFSTERANYHLIAGWHNNETTVNEELLNKTDAYVIETGTAPIRRLDFEQLASHEQYESTIQTLMDDETPIYMVDMACKDKRADHEIEHAVYRGIVKTADTAGRVVPPALGMLSSPLGGLLWATPLITSVAGLAAGRDERLDTAISYGQVSNFYTPSAGRSAQSAEKIERFVAPTIAEQEDQKPDITIEYGAGHCDIRPYLERQKLRDAVARYHDFYNWRPVGASYKDTVGAIRFDDFQDDGPTNQYETENRTQEFQRFIYEIEDLDA